MIDWLSNIESVAGIDPVPASEDASFRRYFRLQAQAESFIVMDAPPEQEDSTSFLRIATYLESMQLNAPRIIEANIELGFLLISDLGVVPYLDILNQTPERAGAMYDDAMGALFENSAARHGLPGDPTALRRALAASRALAVSRLVVRKTSWY